MKYLAMVVDDDPASRYIYDRVLRSMNFSVLQAGDGVVAIELLASHTPDILLLDLLLPRISGLEVLDYVHQAPHLHNLQTAIITAHVNFRATYKLARNEQFLLKPIMLRSLRELVTRVVKTSPKSS